MDKIKVLGLCGSLRADSFNLKLLKNFLPGLDAGPFQSRLYGPLELPLLNQDLEEGPLPRPVLDLHAALAESSVVVIASPEYNASISGVLKNAIDWSSRPPGSTLWKGKIVALLAASPGALGGARGLIHLRTVISGLGAWVIPEQVQVPQAPSAFDGEGRLKEPRVEKQIQAAHAGLKALAEKLL